MVTPEMILHTLPPYWDEWKVVKETQYVPDIIQEIVTVHKLFGRFYDKFSYLFYTTDPAVLADNLFEFCRHYLHYKEEPVKRQTSAIPAGIIERGYVTGDGVDCKHYALFSAGVIGSLNRLYNCCFEAEFCFVGYRRAKEPYHVFVSITDSAEDCDIWIDPTPGSGGTPTLFIEKPI
jgi:hypothetical protein